MNNKLGVVLCTVALIAACGGGGSGDSVGAAPSGTSPTIQSVFYALSPQLAGLTESVAYQRDLNAQGALGFRYSSSLYVYPGNVRTGVLIKDAAATYSYEVLRNPTVNTTGGNVFADQPNAGAELAAQANAQGARGFRFVGLNQGGVYVKNNASTSTFTYQALKRSRSSLFTVSEFLRELNEQGATGWRFVFYHGFSYGSEEVNFYEKIVQNASRYQYEGLDLPADNAGLLAQLNAQGSRGFLRVWEINGVQLYVKDLTQAATFNYVLQAQQDPAADFLAQFNALGAAGYKYFGALTGRDKILDYFYKPSGCVGEPCVWGSL